MRRLIMNSIERVIRVTPLDRAFFNNKVDYCVGTGRMGLALQKEYFDQLKLVQEEIGFKHIRGHGLFTDDMAIFQEYRENFFDPNSPTHIEYNFTYLDLVMDSYKELNIRPFIELGFMPKKLASGEQTIFYWRGNTTPPKDYEEWCKLVKALLNHLIERYGEEAYEYPIEVWNEPNLPGFWYKADMQEYFKLFKESFNAIKAVDPRFKVGGPAICGVRDEEWIREFMKFCRREKLKVDFVTRHHYTTDNPEHDGHYGYAKLREAEDGFANLKTTRDIIDSFEEYKGLPIHITEFNTSYIPNCPIHDTNLNAAYLGQQLSRLGDVNESYSYWTFGDIFEEQGVPFTPFHGGFGMVANGCIPKPTFYAFKFFKQLQGECLKKEDDAIVLKTDKGYKACAWNICPQGEDKSIDMTITLPGEGEYSVICQTVDETTCNPLKLWHDMGEPAHLTKEQTKLLRDAAKPLITSERAVADGGEIAIKLTLSRNALVYIEVIKSEIKPDRGFDYIRATTTL